MQKHLTKSPMLINQPSIIRSMCYFSDKGEAQKDFTKKYGKLLTMQLQGFNAMTLIDAKIPHCAKSGCIGLQWQ